MSGGGEMTDRNDWFAAIFITLIIGAALGYVWGYSRQGINYEARYTEAIEELSVVVRGEICQ